MTSTDIPRERASSKLYPRYNHTRTVTRAIHITTGTNTALMSSANLAMGGLVAFASSTRAIILARVVSEPTCVALNLSTPSPFIVPVLTLSPGCFGIGMLSPVSMDSSTYDFPSITTPSTGIASPGFIITTSPTFTDSTETSTSSPFRSKVAVLGARSISLLTASVVLLLETASKYFPTVIRVRIIAQDSKYRS